MQNLYIKKQKDNFLCKGKIALGIYINTRTTLTKRPLQLSAASFRPNGKKHNKGNVKQLAIIIKFQHYYSFDISKVMPLPVMDLVTFT